MSGTIIIMVCLFFFSSQGEPEHAVLKGWGKRKTSDQHSAATENWEGTVTHFLSVTGTANQKERGRTCRNSSAVKLVTKASSCYFLAARLHAHPDHVTVSPLREENTPPPPPHPTAQRRTVVIINVELLLKLRLLTCVVLLRNCCIWNEDSRADLGPLPLCPSAPPPNRGRTEESVKPISSFPVRIVLRGVAVDIPLWLRKASVGTLGRRTHGDGGRGTGGTTTHLFTPRPQPNGEERQSEELLEKEERVRRVGHSAATRSRRTDFEVLNAP